MKNREIERKFLVQNDSWRESVEKSYSIKQGYFPTDPGATIRIRIKGEKGFLTIKGPTQNLSRSEFEYEIPVSDAEQMLSEFCAAQKIEKVRSIVPFEGKIWEVDEFFGKNAPLIIAEVELEDAEESIQIPNWIGDEVSTDPRYYNSNLIVMPYCDWK
jgi:CYTH domain-containing protein